MAAGANIAFGPNLGQVVMPLVQLLRCEGFSWDQREQIADAIRKVSHHYGDVPAERIHSINKEAAATIVHALDRAAKEPPHA